MARMALSSGAPSSKATTEAVLMVLARLIGCRTRKAVAKNSKGNAIARRAVLASMYGIMSQPRVVGFTGKR